MRRFHKPQVVGRIKPQSIRLDGHRFDSKAEVRRYGELRALERAGEIRGLAIHPKLDLVINGRRIGVGNRPRGYLVLDFRYQEPDPAGGWRDVYEDVKGVDTDVAAIKRSIAEAIHGIEIRLVRGR